ncbi:MAG: SUMF1/EgtB/PvdO family nonheme iron enzyme [Planctomycetes bacterium]|nr:SUMF1/EgtB/PvdO family nonheme iron enzyme [Planctomycetota bacterium]
MPESPRSHPSSCELPDDVFQALVGLLDREISIAERELELAALERRWPDHAAALRRAFDLMLRDARGTVPSICDLDDRDPEQIGPYRILERLGKGGMGVVYAAEQRTPVRRRVALKVVKQGMATREVLARFALERRALAAMSHPCIARVLDAGATERGEPYFVMELVQGLPITTYCDKHRLSLDERLTLFQQVCAGVQHAHQKGVIHRDLKPGNVLVAREGDEHVPKVLDFGLAKATNHDFLEASHYTGRDRVLGTPEYMAPEQAMGDGEVIDVRADVYSLGVMLYELLAGQLPFTTEELRRAGVIEALRLIREQDPPKPSTKLLSRRDTAHAHAERCRSSAHALTRALRGDLDWVVMRALSKEPERRYDSANALAMELQRYRSHEPVLAGPPGAIYRLRKLLRRYRVQAVAAAVVLVAILAGGAAASIGFGRANARAAELAKKTAEAESNARESAENARAANERKAEFDQVAGVVVHERAVAGIEELYPAWPDKIPAIEAWLQGDVKRLRELRPAIETTLQKLRDRALPWTEEQQRADREGHGRYAEWQRLRDEVASLERAAAVRAGGELPAVDLPEALRDADPRTLNAFAWPRVAPQAEEREVFGEEFAALAAAERAVARAREAGDPELYQYLDTLAWALVATGQDGRAQTVSQEVVGATPVRVKLKRDNARPSVARELGQTEQVLRDRRERMLALDREVATRQTWTFADEQDRFLFGTLGGLVEKLDALESTQVAEVREKLLRWAEHLRSLETDRDWRLAWARAAEAIASNARYAESPLPSLKPQTGLWPIGENPLTHLYEFYHLRSAWDGESELASIAIPAHDPETGFIDVQEGTGIVFVLIPGGTYTLGAQAADRNGPNYDPRAESDETPHQVTLSPYLLARHELTQAQWRRLAVGGLAATPSYYGPGYRARGMDAPVDWTHPVERVDWSICDVLLRRHGLTLPTESQWECGCRAGTDTVWFCGSDEADLEGFANVLDQRAQKFSQRTGADVGWDDGYLLHAPVDALEPNGYGLFDLHGNVWEWCQDDYGSYARPPRPGSGLRVQGDGSGLRVIRGGCFLVTARYARSACRIGTAPAIRNLDLGARPARIITDN